MKRLLLGMTFAIGVTIVAAVPALASGSPTPEPGFGQCVSMMAHAGTATGAILGQCVSAMAHGLCPCPPGMMS